MTDISIIVPVYNIKEYLPRCVDSILKQRLDNFELILVDDGSIDQSGEICDKYAEEDDRVKVIHQPNSGVSTARNNGIAEATGRYIGFVDGDDWIAEDMYSSLFETAEKNEADIVICDCCTVLSKKSEPDTLPSVPKNTILKKNGMLPEQLIEMAGASCRCLYRSEIIKSINFPVDMKISEDRVFNIKAMGSAKKLFYLARPLYYRFDREGSAVNKYYPDYISMVMLARKRTFDALEAYWDDSFKTVFETQTIGLCYTALNMVYYKTNKKSGREKLNELKKICNDPVFSAGIESIGADDVRARLVKGKHYRVLALLSKLANLKNGR